MTISLNRIGLIVNNPIYCSIKSDGNNEPIPNYIQSEITRQESLANTNYDYRPVDSIIKFENNNRTVSVNLLKVISHLIPMIRVQDIFIYI